MSYDPYMNYAINKDAVEACANTFNSQTNKSANRRALSQIDTSRLVIKHIGGPYDYTTAKQEALKMLKKELKRRGKI